MQRDLALLVIILTYFGVAVGEYPHLRMNRATIALVGAVALVAIGALSFQAAVAALDADTVVLLLAMMVLNVHLRLAGFFQAVGAFVITHARTPRSLLAWIMVASAVLSALFLNDTIVLMFTPLILHVTSTLKRDPIPYLIGLVTAANIGSTATITGNPQNMLIGMASGIPFLEFVAALAPVAFAGTIIAWLVLIGRVPLGTHSGSL
jgi:Na+/H+ antiporter NhaD/arsenite permease-like protein